MLHVKYGAQLTGTLLAIDERELDLINQANPTASFTMEDVEAGKLLALEGTIANDQPNMNGLRFSPEWQQSLLDKWTGTILVWSDESHQPDDDEDYGYLYSARLNQHDGITETVARIVVPVLPEPGSERLVARLKSGLSRRVSPKIDFPEGLKAKCSQCGAPFEDRLRCPQHPNAETIVLSGGVPDHIAITTKPAMHDAGFQAIAASQEDQEQPSADTPELEKLREENAELKRPIVEKAIKFLMMNDPKADRESLTVQLSTWSVEDLNLITMNNKAAIEARMPGLTQQYSQGDGARDDVHPMPVEWKPINEVLEQTKPK